jgi:WD40 repeat protein
VASTTDGRAQIWDADRGAPLAELTSERKVLVTAFATNDTGTVGVGGDRDGNATVWDLTMGEPMMRLPCGSMLITAVAITPDGSMAATATYGGEVTVWDLDSGEPAVSLNDKSRVTALALSPTADRLLVGGEVLSMYDLAGTDKSGDRSPRLITRLLTSYDVTAAVFNPVMPAYALFGGARGQVAYVRLPVDSLHVGPDSA